jgi:hypothetical protein
VLRGADVVGCLFNNCGWIEHWGHQDPVPGVVGFIPTDVGWRWCCRHRCFVGSFDFPLVCFGSLDAGNGRETLVVTSGGEEGVVVERSPGLGNRDHSVHCDGMEGNHFQLNRLQFSIWLMAQGLIMLTRFIVRNVLGQTVLQAVDVNGAAEAVVTAIEPLVVVVIVRMFEYLLFHCYWYA